MCFPPQPGSLPLRPPPPLPQVEPGWGCSIIFYRVAVARFRTGMPSRSPGFDLLSAVPPGQPASLVLHDIIFLNAFCFEEAVAFQVRARPAPRVHACGPMRCIHTPCAATHPAPTRGALCLGAVQPDALAVLAAPPPASRLTPHAVPHLTSPRHTTDPAPPHRAVPRRTPTLCRQPPARTLRRPSPATCRRPAASTTRRHIPWRAAGGSAPLACAAVRGRGGSSGGRSKGAVPRPGPALRLRRSRRIVHK